LRRAKLLGWVSVLVIVDHLLKLSLIIIVLNLSVIVQGSPHLMVLLLPSKRWYVLEILSLWIIFLGRPSSLMRLIIDLASLPISELLISKLSVQLRPVLRDF